MTDTTRLAGRVLMVGLPASDLDAETRRMLRVLQPGGVLLFRRNLESPDQTRALLDEVRALIPAPAWVALDQEGGRVSRIEAWVGPTPSAAELTGLGEEASRRFGRATAELLASLGFNLDFAPVLDLCSADATNGIGDRSFGTDPAQVTRMAGQFLRGLQDQGVAGCLKHFPGLGDTRVDSHRELPTVRRDRDALESFDLAPFRHLAHAAAMVMVGHGYYPALDPSQPVPATLSSNVIQGLLRGLLGYRGPVASDDMDMGAVAPLDLEGSAAVRALDAGCDLLLYCNDLERALLAHTALCRAARERSATHERLVDAAERVRLQAARWADAGPRRPSWDQARNGMTEFNRLA